MLFNSIEAYQNVQINTGYQNIINSYRAYDLLQQYDIVSSYKYSYSTNLILGDSIIMACPASRVQEGEKLGTNLKYTWITIISAFTNWITPRYLN